MQRPRIVSKIVLAACTLHSLLAEKNPSRMQLATDSEEPTTHENQPGEWRHQNYENPIHGLQRELGNTGTQFGKRVRDYLTEYYNGVGAVPWQNRMMALQDN